MKETIILATGIHESELRRSLALRENNCINLRVYKPVDWIRMALMKSGIIISNSDDYETILDEVQNVIDNKPNPFNPTKDIEFVVLKEFPLGDEDNALLKAISFKKPTEKSISELFKNKIIDKKDIKSNHKFNHFDTMNNEVQWILNDCNKKEHLDECVVAVTDTMYINKICDIIRDKAKDFPISLGCRIIKHSMPGKLLDNYYTYLLNKKKHGYNRTVSKFFSDKSFNWKDLNEQMIKQFDSKGNDQEYNEEEFKNLLNRLCLTNDSKKNEDYLDNLEGKEGYISCLKYLATEIVTLPIEDFIDAYSFVRPEYKTYDEKAKDLIVDKLKEFRSAHNHCNITRKFIDEVLKYELPNLPSEPGKLHVTRIQDAFSTMRNYLYIVGCCKHKLPNKPDQEKVKKLFEISRNLGIEVSVSFTRYINASDKRIKDDICPTGNTQYNRINGPIEVQNNNFKTEPSYSKESPSHPSQSNGSNKKDIKTTIRTTQVKCTTFKKKPELDPKLWGKMIHKLMEFLVISKGKIKTKYIAKEVVLLFSNRLNKDDMTNVEKILKKVADNILKDKDSNPDSVTMELLSPNSKAYCEVPYSYLYQKDNLNIVQAGYIDVVYYYKGKWHIIDYKTNKIDNDNTLDNLTEKYKPQLNEYINAFKNITGKKVDATLYHIDIYN